MSYIRGMEKLHMAVFNLVGPGSLQSRLSNAVNSHLLHIAVGSDLPNELGEDYFNIVNSVKDDALSEIEAEHLAQKIVGLHEKFNRFMH